MSVFLHAVATAVPPTEYPQAVIRDVIRAQPGLERLSQRIVSTVFNASGIDKRHSVIDEFGAQGATTGLFLDSETGEMLSPTTQKRNELYTREATKLFVESAHQVLADSGLKPADITHVVTVSCTGFYAPGPDFAVVRALGLSQDVHRFHVGFMGCYAAFPALKMARAFCEADPSATVLVICTELCTLHMRSSNDTDTIIASSVFADGAAAALISARPPAVGRPALRLDYFETTLTPVGIGEAEMAWTIGDQGFEMVLSTYVPSIIETHIEGALAPLLARESELQGRAANEIEHWAIHPGGRSILDKVESSLALSSEQLAPSREVLRQYGNMSSATVLFILKDLLQSARKDERVCAMAFGPGLTVESGLMTKVCGAP
jgi:predicted naringenin-chalcone synthase